MCDELSWSHYRTLLSIENENEINYYILQCKNLHLSLRQLIFKIKSNEYERLDDNIKNKLINNNDFIGIIICRIDNEVVIRYCLYENIFIRKYVVI